MKPLKEGLCLQKMTTVDADANARTERLKHINAVGQPICRFCPPFRGENRRGRKGRRARSDRYKNHRRN